MAKNARRSVNQARGGSSRTPTIAAVVAVVIVAVVVFGGIFLSGRGGGSGGNASTPIPVSQVQASYPTRVEGGVVVAGQGPRTIEIYEDAQCPACQQFEATDGPKITDALNAGRVTVRYHLVNLLDRSSNPPGYSTLGGNALMCAAENNAFPTLHKTLYDAQPPENGSGFTNDQLVDVGQRAGAGPGYAACVQNRVHSGAVAQNFQQAVTDPALVQPDSGSFATPTIVINGKVVDRNAPDLDRALA